MNKLLVITLLVGLVCPVVAKQSSKELVHEMNLIHADWLRKKIVKFPKKATVEVILKNGKIIRGTFQNFVKYDDGFWILPLNKHGLFADDVYDISELLDVKIIVLGYV